MTLILNTGAQMYGVQRCNEVLASTNYQKDRMQTRRLL